MNQPELFHGEHLPSRLKYQVLFESLPLIPYTYSFGRPGVDPNVMLRACIYRCVRGLNTLSDLNCSLCENPSLCEAIGLDPFKQPPGVERFSRWLQDTPNETLASLRNALVGRLVEKGAVSGQIVAFDSTAALSPVRENNLKTTVADRFNKTRPPKSDPEARLGVFRYYMASKTQKIRYFWGYRNHALVDFHTELPLGESTFPANYHETRCAVPLLQSCVQNFGISIQVVCGDSGYDSEKIIAYIVDELKARPVIAPNNRYQPNPEFRHKGKDVICPANLPMVRKGQMTPKRTGITYTQFSCPLYYNKSMRDKYLFCPADHPKYLAQKGCNHLVRHNPSPREQIPYSSAEFADLYRKRTAVERVFARLLSMAMQKPTVRGLNATRNQCTIAHITVLLVANVAYDTGNTDQLAFVRTFIPRFLGS